MAKQNRPSSAAERIKYNLGKYLRDVTDFVVQMLQFVPKVPHGQYRVRVHITVEQVSDEGEVISSFYTERMVVASVPTP